MKLAFVFILALAVAIPKLVSSSPSSGHAGTQITVTGENLQDAFLVKVGPETAQVVSKSGTTLVITAPPQQSKGKKHITVATWGKPTVTLKNAFEYTQ